MRQLAVPAAVLLLVALGFVALARLTREVSFGEVRAAVDTLPAWRLALALALTAASYLALTLYDVLALHVIGRPLPWRTAAVASFTSYTLSHNLGLSLLTGGSARYRIYTGAGIDGPDVARVVGLASASFWTSVVAVAGAALALAEAPLSVPGMRIGEGLAHAIGWAAMASVAALIGFCGVRRAPIRLFGWSTPLPNARQALAQVGVVVADFACASGALFVLVPDTAPALLPAFVLAYALGIVATALSHVPGGVGVFEAVLIAALPGDRTAMLAALLVYRLVYYPLPLAAGILLLAWHEGARRRRWRGRLARGVGTVARGVAPLASSAATFLGGAMLLLSGSLPSLHARMGVLAGILPLPFIEASHVAASLVGTGLLLLAPGLYRRLDGAFVATRALLLAGAAFSLAKGIDYEEAMVCLALAGILQWTRAAFYRRTALTQAPLTTAWFAAAAMAVGSAVWAGFFAYRTVPYGDDLWWQFALHGDAPRFLRAMLGVAVTLGGALLWQLMAPARPAALAHPTPADMFAVRRILAGAARTDAMLALTGDKRFLLSDAGAAFVMYRIEGASWIVMSDPVGLEADWSELLWGLNALVDRQQGRLLLYEVSPRVLDLAIGMGLQIVKYGEEALIHLAGFDLDTPALRSVRKSQRAAAKRGAAFRIVAAADVPAIMDELAAVSGEWRALKGQREKGFSLGRFDPVYLAQFDVAVVEVAGRIVAFANLWLTANRQEASVDLMRHRAETPLGTMDFLFVSLIQWAKAQGYARFALGMAPLSGIEGRRLAPAWAKLANLVFRHGERFYGFRGLRAYKQKYAPAWEPRYVAGPSGIGLVKALRDLSHLTSRPAADLLIAPSPVPASTVPARVPSPSGIPPCLRPTSAPAVTAA